MTAPRPCVLFDLDDTLLDHRHSARRGAQAVYLAFQSHFADDEAVFWERWHEVTEAAMEAFSRGELSIVEQRRVRMRAMFQGVALSDELADARYTRYVQAYFENLRLFDDALPCLDALADFRLALITNGGAHTQRKKLERSGLGPRFEFMLTPTSELRGKPEADLFDLAASTLGVAHGECIYVGDKLDTDAQAASRTGMHGVWLDRSSGTERTGRVGSLDELVEFVHRWRASGWPKS